MAATIRQSNGRVSSSAGISLKSAPSIEESSRIIHGVLHIQKSSLKTFRNELGFNIPSLSKETSMLNKIRYENKFLKVVVMVLIVFTTLWSSPVSAQDKINPRVLKDTENGQTAH